MAIGYIGGIPKIMLLKIGMINPIKRPYKGPQIYPVNKAGMCIGKSLLPILGICPVKKGSTIPNASRSPPFTILLVDCFLKVFLLWTYNYSFLGNCLGFSFLFIFIKLTLISQFFIFFSQCTKLSC